MSDGALRVACDVGCGSLALAWCVCPCAVFLVRGVFGGLVRTHVLQLGASPVLAADQVPPAVVVSSDAMTGWATVIPGAYLDYLLLFDGGSAPRCFMLPTFVATPLATGYELFTTALTLVHDFDKVRVVTATHARACACGVRAGAFAVALRHCARVVSNTARYWHIIMCRTGCLR